MIIFKISNQKLMNLMVLDIYFSEYKHNTLPMVLDVIQNSEMLYLHQYEQNSVFHWESLKLSHIILLNHQLENC